ncbi:MAG: TetR/AcrR family transcriptional regulator [Thermoleophilia bacterium]|nr:TetR/AcrR family transcriptional regulator [Thermoleophilia bacterium]
MKAVAEPSTARGRATRQRILQAAEECFARHGYAEASVAEIVRRSSVAQGSFYNYFESKAAIFAELIRSLQRQMTDATREGALRAAGRSRVEAEVEGTKAFLEWLAEHRDLHRLLHLIDEADPRLAVEFFGGFAKGYAEGLAEAMQEGEVQRIDPELLAFALMGMNHFVSMRWMLWDRDGELPPELMDDFARIIAGALRGAAVR